MRILFETILLMSVLGSVVYCIASAITWGFKDKLRAATQYKIRLWCMGLFVLPLFIVAIPLIWQFAADDLYARALIMTFDTTEIIRNSMIENAVVEGSPDNIISMWNVTFLSRVWLFGVATLLILFVAKYIVFRYKFIRKHSVCDDITVLAALTETSMKMGINRKISVRWNTQSSPMLGDILAPVILIPKIQYSEKELFLIFEHELTHYLRKDLIIKTLLELIYIVHWFNPLVWYLRKQILYWMECSCDERVISGLSFGEKKDYGNLILKTAIPNPYYAFATNFSGNAKQLKSRLSRLLLKEGYSKPIISILVFCAVIVSSVACISTSAFAYSVTTSSVPQEDKISRLIWPTQGRNITYPYSSEHTGIDIMVRGDTDISSAEKGVVLEIGYDQEGLGHYVLIGHWDGQTSTLYAHLEEIYVSKGQIVREEEIIAKAGNSGGATGVMLHLQVSYNNEPVDPEPYF